MEFIDEDSDAQQICMYNLLCMDKFCSKLHPRAFAGICIGFLNSYCKNQSICGLQHFSIEQLRDKIQQHPINGIRQYNLCPTNCENLRCRYLHPPWLKNICLQCLNKTKQCKGEPALIHKVTWDKLRDIVYKEYSISGVNPEMFCVEINCDCPAKIYNFDQFCIKNFKGICPMLDGRCIMPHKSWESLKENSLQKVKEKAIVAKGCIKFDEKDKSFIKQQQKQQNMQVFIEQSSLSTMVNQIELRPQVDIIFIIDCTISMADWLIAAKHNIKFIIKEFTKKISVSSCVRLAAVCYRDFTDGPNHIQYHDFTVQPEEIEKFIDKFQPNGGDDIPEDLIGALDVAYNLNISKHPDSILQIFTITDAPCHGKKYHDLIIDDMPDTNNLEEKLEKFVQKKKRFFFSFISIRQQTDKMEEIFKKCVPNYSSAKITENKFSDYVLFSLSATMHKSTKIEDDNEFIFREVKYRKQQQMNYIFETRDGSYMNQFRSQMKRTKLEKKYTLLQIEKSELNLENYEKGQNVQVFKAFDQKNNIYVVNQISFFLVIMSKIFKVNQILKVLLVNPIENSQIYYLIAKKKLIYYGRIIGKIEKLRQKQILIAINRQIVISLFQLIMLLQLFQKHCGFKKKPKQKQNYIQCNRTENFYLFIMLHHSYIILIFQYLEQRSYMEKATLIQTYLGRNIVTMQIFLKKSTILHLFPILHMSKPIKTLLSLTYKENQIYLVIHAFIPKSQKMKGTAKKLVHQKCTPLCISLKLPKNMLQTDASQIRQYEQIIDVFGGKTDQSKLQKICANCNCQEKLENLSNLQEICSGCLEKKKQVDVSKCECCNEEFKISFNYEQLQETFINFCKNCKNSDCNMFNQQCHYCQSKICKQTEKTIQIQNKTYYICLDAFHYLRQIRCTRCQKEYQFKKLLTKEEYCDNHYNYICNTCA